MSTYFEAINEQNKVIIDDTTKRFCVSRTGLLSTCALRRSFTGLGAFFSAPTYERFGYSIGCYYLILSDEEVFASFYLPSDFGRYNFMCASHINANTIKVIVMSTYTSADTYDVLANKVRFYTYAPNPYKTTNSGIEIFNSDGNQIFTSENKYVNVAGMYSRRGVYSSGSANNLDEFAYTDFYNNKHAIVINSQNIFQTGQGQGSSLFGIYGLGVDSNGRYICKLNCYDFVWITGNAGGSNAFFDYMPQNYSSHTQFTAIDISNH